jgi:hypothetical protein
MPPWPADPHYSEFTGQKVMTEGEIATIETWVKNGMPEGGHLDPADLPTYPDGSLTGVPDLRLPVQPVTLERGSSDRFLLVKVPFELPENSFARLIEFYPGRENVVHHVNGDMVAYEDGRKSSLTGGVMSTDMINDSTVVQAYKKLDLTNDDGSFPSLKRSVVNYLPGATGQHYPDGIGGVVLPRKGVFLLNDLHYGFTKKKVVDSSYINVYLTKVPPSRPILEFQLGTLGVSPVEPNLVISPNTVKTVVSRYTVTNDISILTINPHMHLLGVSFKAYALRPTGDTIRLISIPKWDFNWQYFYTFKHMVKIPAGSSIVAEGTYDNTRKNLNNPFSPPRVVSDREGSMKATDEMFQFIVSYLPYQPGDEQISLE